MRSKGSKEHAESTTVRGEDETGFGDRFYSLVGIGFTRWTSAGFAYATLRAHIDGF